MLDMVELIGSVLSPKNTELMIKELLFNKNQDDFSENLYEMNNDLNRVLSLSKDSITTLVNFIPVSETVKYPEEIQGVVNFIVEEIPNKQRDFRYKYVYAISIPNKEGREQIINQDIRRLFLAKYISRNNPNNILIRFEIDIDCITSFSPCSVGLYTKMFYDLMSPINTNYRDRMATILLKYINKELDRRKYSGEATIDIKEV